VFQVKRDIKGSFDFRIKDSTDTVATPAGVIMISLEFVSYGK